MTRMECEVFLRVSGFMIGISAFVGGQAAMQDDWLWVFMSVIAIGFGAEMFSDMRKRLDLFKKKEKNKGDNE